MRYPFRACLSALHAFRPKAFPFLCCLLPALPAHADGTRLERARIQAVAILQTFTGASKVVDGVRVYGEGTPLVGVKLYPSSGSSGLFVMFPYSGDKAKAILDALQSAGDREVTLYYSDDHLTSRTECDGFGPAGCIELGSTIASKTLQYVSVNY